MNDAEFDQPIVIESLAAKHVGYVVWGRELNGFAVYVLPSGNKAFQVQYRQGGRTRRKSPGRVGTALLYLARPHVHKVLGRVAVGVILSN